MSLQAVCDKLARQAAGESGRIRENRLAILPRATSLADQGLQPQREKREIFLPSSHARGRAGAHTRARREEYGAGDSLFPPILPAPGPVTLLKHCRCADCVRSRAPAGSSLACPLPHVCLPAPDEWHYCAEYHGPQISKDVWAWPRRRRAEVAEVSVDAPGPSGGPSEKNRRENGSEAGFFRSTAGAQGKETP